MASAKIYASGDTYTYRHRAVYHGGEFYTGQNFSKETVYKYGSRYNDIGGTTYDIFTAYAYLQFNLSNVLAKKINSAKLYQSRTERIHASDNTEKVTVSALSVNNVNTFIDSVTMENSEESASLVQSKTVDDDYAEGTVFYYDIGGLINIGTVQSDYLTLRLHTSADYSNSYQNMNVQKSAESGEGYPYLLIEYSDIPADPPSDLLPSAGQNPRGNIVFSWKHNPAETMRDDPQTGWRLTLWQDGVPPLVIQRADSDNTYMLPAFTFTEYKTVYYKVETLTQYNGYSKPSTGQFSLITNPPLKSALIYPLNIALNGSGGIPLEWRYNSPHDTAPPRFDIRYNLNEGAWMHKSNAGQLSFTIDPITVQSKVQWQVMAYGALGDAGPWSETGVFWTIGAPDTPVIVKVSNSNRPVIYFSAVNLLSWDLEIFKNGGIVYESRNQAFTGDYTHVTDRFFENGDYIVRMRITNEYGLTSEWGQLSFTIKTAAPPPLTLRIVDNPQYNLRLHFNNTSGRTVYIYRSEFRKNSYLRIAKTNRKVFDDYTVRPGRRYEYFVRAVTGDFAFSDSNIVTGVLYFPETTLAEYSTPENMLKFSKVLDGSPQKNISFTYEKTLTHFAGRNRPVLQMGELTGKSISFSFHCTTAEYELLEQMHQSRKILILRDWRRGVVYGTINGALSAAADMDGENVSFLFTETDFNTEIEI